MASDEGKRWGYWDWAFGGSPIAEAISHSGFVSGLYAQQVVAFLEKQAATNGKLPLCHYLDSIANKEGVGTGIAIAMNGLVERIENHIAGKSSVGAYQQNAILKRWMKLSVPIWGS